MPSTSIRWTVAKHLVDLMEGHALLDGVTVEPGWPGDRVPIDELVFLAPITSGDLDIPVMTAGRKHRNDIFRLRFVILVLSRPDLDTTQTRLAEIAAGIEDVLAEDPTLDDLDGIVSAQVKDMGQQAVSTPEGVVGDGFVEIEVHTRLT